MSSKLNSVDHLLKNSGLPGPRANLTLLYAFAKNATAEEVNACLTFYASKLSDQQTSLRKSLGGKNEKSGIILRIIQPAKQKWNPRY
jgi:hypothetical protein